MLTCPSLWTSKFYHKIKGSRSPFRMRSQRSYMVQTTEQYQFVYSALTEHTLFGNTEFEIEEIDNILDEGVRELPGGVNGFSHQVIKCEK